MAVTLGSCVDFDEPGGTMTGMKPVYIPKTQAFDIASESPRTLDDPGKIYMYGNYVFIVEKSLGVHIIDNSDKTNPVKLSFISVPGINDVAVKGQVMYVDNVTDLVALDISDINEVSVSKRIKDVYPIDQMFYPLNYQGRFECVDTSLGYVVGWVETELDNPKCYR
jgi:hypothetical protein